MNAKALVAALVILLVLALVVFAAVNQKDAASVAPETRESTEASVEELQHDRLDEALADLEKVDETALASAS